MQVELHYNTHGIPVRNTYDLDEVLDVYAGFHYLVVEDQITKDWLEGYALVYGKRVSVLLPTDPYPSSHQLLRLTFPTLDLSLL